MLGGARGKEKGSETTAERAPRQGSHDPQQHKFKPADAETTSLLYEVCGRLGHLPVGKSEYVLSIDFSDALEDLIRLMLVDEGQLMVKLAEMEIVAKHLVPMLFLVSRARFESALFTLLDLLLLFTSVDVIANRAPAGTRLDWCRRHKKTFESKRVFETLLALLVSCVSVKNQSSPQDGNLMRKILSLVRNLLAIPDAAFSYMSMNVTLASAFGRQERLISVMQHSRIIEFFMVGASSCNDARDGLIFAPHAPLLVEIFQCLFCTSDPDAIALMQNHNQDTPQISATEQSLQKETKIRKPIRHGRFSGSVVLRLATGEDYVLNGTRLNEHLVRDDGKRVQHGRKKFSINDFGDNASSVRSCEKTMIFDIASEFLTSCFNELVVYFTGHWKDVERSESFYWNLMSLTSWSMRFCRRLQENHENHLSLELIAAAVSAENLTFHARALRKFLNEKQQSMLLSCTIFFREAFRLLDLMINSSDSQLAETAQSILSSVFYRYETVSIFRLVLQSSQRLTLKTLRIVVEVNHVVLKLLKNYCGEKRSVYILRAKRGTADEQDSGQEDRDGDEDVARESEFVFSSFIVEYATEAAVNPYIRLLREAAGLDQSTNRFVATMLGRLVSDARLPELLYRASVMDAIHGILVSRDVSWRRKNAELIKTVSFIARSFVQKTREDPLFIIAAFFNSLSISRLPRHPQTEIQEPLASEEDLVKIPEHWTLAEKIRWLVRIIVDCEHSAALNWLASRLFDAAASRKLDDEEVNDASSCPFSDFCNFSGSIKQAFRNAHFRKLLCEIGFTPPSREDPSWKLSAGIPSHCIIEHAASLQTATRDSLEAGCLLVGSADGKKSSTIRKELPGTEESITGQEPLLESLTTESSEEEQAAECNDSPQNANTSSRWQVLKRSNFFLNAKNDADTDEKSETAGEDGERKQMGKVAKRIPLAIYSDGE